MYIETGRPMRGFALERLKKFLQACDLDYDEGIEYTAALMEDGEIIASGSLDGGTIKCIAVSPAHQGEDLTAALLTELFREAAQRGLRHLMLFTKPKNQMMFSAFGFHPVIRTADCLMMENRRNGLADFLKGLEKPEKPGITGCIVANCNPFTNGHLHLVETAAKQCDALHLFILSEDKGMFSPKARIGMARQACAHLKNVYIHETGPYMISSATFPSYFIKAKARIEDIYCDLDIRLFGEKIAPALGISRRYVGTEPECTVTNAYNHHLKQKLPEYGIELIEISRMAIGGLPLSASRVRQLIRDKNFEEIQPMVPDAAYSYIISNYTDREG